MKTPMEVIFCLALILICLTASSCHTVEGMGQDIEQAGQAIQNAAD